MMCTAQQIFFRSPNKREKERPVMQHVWGNDRRTQGFGGEPE